MTSIRIRYQCHQCKNRVSCSFSLGDRTCCIGVMKSPAKPHQIMTKTVPLLVMFLISKGCSAWNFQGARCDALIFRWAKNAAQKQRSERALRGRSANPKVLFQISSTTPTSWDPRKKNELEGGKMVHFLM